MPIDIEPDSSAVDTVQRINAFLSATCKGDPLSVPDIARLQMEAEEIIQGLAAAELEISESQDDAELRYRLVLDEVLRSGEVPISEGGRKLTAEERHNRALQNAELRVLWERLRNAERQTKYLATLGKSMFARLSSLQSRLRAATQAGFAHQQYGEG